VALKGRHEPVGRSSARCVGEQQLYHLLELNLGAIVLTFPLRSSDGRGQYIRVGVVAHDKRQIWDRETVIRIRPAAPSDPLRGVASLFMGHVMRALLI
jgi:hypothetical protein